MRLEVIIRSLIVPHLLSLHGSLVIKNLFMIALIILWLVLAGKFTIGVLFSMTPYFLLHEILNMLSFVIHSIIPRGGGLWFSSVLLMTIITREVWSILSLRSLHITRYRLTWLYLLGILPILLNVRNIAVLNPIRVHHGASNRLKCLTLVHHTIWLLLHKLLLRKLRCDNVLVFRNYVLYIQFLAEFVLIVYTLVPALVLGKLGRLRHFSRLLIGARRPLDNWTDAFI